MDSAFVANVRHYALLVINAILWPFRRAAALVAAAFAWAFNQLRLLAKRTWIFIRDFTAPVVNPVVRFLKQLLGYILRWIAYIIVAAIYCAFALGVSVFIYSLLYYTLIPDVSHTRPLYFDFSAPTPRAVSTFVHREGGRFLASGYHYDFTIEMEMPESEVNAQMGMFMTSLALLSFDGTVLYNSSRPAMLRYKNDLLRNVYTLFWSVPLVLGLMEEKQSLAVTPIEDWIDDWDKPFAFAVSTLSKPQLQMYKSTLHIDVKLTGLSYFCYYWFFTAAFTFISLLFWVQTFVVLFAYLLYKRYAAAGEKEEEMPATRRPPSRFPRKPGAGEVTGIPPGRESEEEEEEEVSEESAESEEEFSSEEEESNGTGTRLQVSEQLPIDESGKETQAKKPDEEKAKEKFLMLLPAEGRAATTTAPAKDDGAGVGPYVLDEEEEVDISTSTSPSASSEEEEEGETTTLIGVDEGDERRQRGDKEEGIRQRKTKKAE